MIRGFSNPDIRAKLNGCCLIPMFSAKLGEDTEKEFIRLGLAADPYRDALKVKCALAGWSPNADGRFSLPALLVDCSIGAAALPFLIAAWRWITGDAATIDWGQVGANLGGFVTLLVVWSFLRKLNQATAEVLEHAIEEIDPVRKQSHTGGGNSR